MLKNESPALRRSLLIIVMAFMLMGIEYAFASPLFEVSDEVRHFAYIEHLAQGKGLIVQDVNNPGFYEQDGSQPPLYYALMTPIALLAGIDDFRELAQFNPHSSLGFASATNNWNMLIHREGELALPWQKTTLAVLLVRLMGVLMGAVTVLCAYGLARELVRPALRSLQAAGALPPALAMAPVLAAALAAFTPMFLYISASVNNDTLVVMLSSLGLWLAARAINQSGGPTPKQAALLGVLMGLAALTKASALGLAGVIPLFLLMAAWAGGKSIRQIFALAVAVGLPIVLIAGWWYARNQILYADFTGTWTQAIIDGLRDPPITLIDALGEWTGFRQAYWGLFGGVNIPMTWWIYTFLDLFAALGFVGSLIYFFSLHRRGGTEKKEIRNEEIRNNLAPNNSYFLSLISRRLSISAVKLVWLMCAAVMAVNLASLIRWTMMTYASQGRLMFPVIAAISSFMAIGVAFVVSSVLGLKIGFLRKTRFFLRDLIYQPRFALGHIGQFALLAALAPVVFIAPAYARPPRGQSEAQLPADLAKTELRFGEGMRWIGYRVAPDKQRIEAGQPLEITLFWQATKPITQNVSLGLRVFNKDGTQLALLDTHPGGGTLPTSQWRVGEIIADRYQLNLPELPLHPEQTNVLPMNLWLDVSAWDFATKQFLPTFDAQGKPTGRQRYLVGGWGSLKSDLPADTNLGRLDKAQFQSVSVLQNGAKLTLNVNWLVGSDFPSAPDAAYTTFVHLFNAQGEKVASGDAPPYFSTRWWRKGDLVPNDTYAIDLPAGLPPGGYTLKFGLYHPADGARMPAFDAQGKPINDAAIEVKVEVR